jgi:hypothetical protein
MNGFLYEDAELQAEKYGGGWGDHLKTLKKLQCEKCARAKIT